MFVWCRRCGAFRSLLYEIKGNISAPHYIFISGFSMRIVLVDGTGRASTWVERENDKGKNQYGSQFPPR